MSEILTVKTDEFEMDYFHFGKGKKPFVILPGLSIKSVMLSAEAIEQGFVDFTEDFCVYVFDRTKKVEQGVSIDKLAQDTAFAMKALGLKDCYIFGASQGGMMGLLISENYPELVKKLVVGSSLGKMNETAVNCISHWISLAKEKKKQQLNDSFIEKVYSKETIEKYGEYLRNGWQKIEDEELNRFILLAESSAEFDCEDRLDCIRCQTFIIGAENDQVVTVQASIDLAEKLNCRLFVYKDFGHGVYDEAIDYRAKVLEFMKE